MVESECRQAVVRTYHSMIDVGGDHHNAFRVAERVFRWHQRQTPDEQREALILSWVRAHWLN